MVKPIHLRSLRDPMRPLVLCPHLLNPETVTTVNDVLVKIDATRKEEALGFIEARWQTRNPRRVFVLRFLEEDIDRLYASETQLSQILSGLCILATVVACLGLLGLSGFAAAQRIKEVGVRKVLGASTGGVVVTLSTDFVKLVLLAIVVAWPLSYCLVDWWLEDFAYKTPVSPVLFAVASAGMVALAALSVGTRTLRAALANPVDALRTE